MVQRMLLMVVLGTIVASCALRQPHKSVAASAMWIPMDSISSGGVLPAHRAIDNATDSLNLSAVEMGEIWLELQSERASWVNRRAMRHYTNNVRLAVVEGADIVLISDGCDLVALSTRRRVKLPDKLIRAIASKPSQSGLWICREANVLEMIGSAKALKPKLWPADIGREGLIR